MNRPAVIDPNDVLNAAEKIVRNVGVAGLTIGGVAREAGISKGGVQSCFGTKDGLVRAMFERWTVEFESMVDEQAGPDADARAILGAHIMATRRTDEAQADRSAGLMTALLNHEALRESSAQWYQQRFALMDTRSARGRQARLAFLACEGAFLLRCFGFVKMDDAQWQDIFTDICKAFDQKEPAAPRAGKTR